MDAQAVKRVTEALQARLKPLGTVYVGPLDDDDAADAEAVLFLYRVAVNPDLRNMPHAVQPASPGDPPIAYEGALPLDLYYILTVGDTKTGGEIDSLGTLGRAMQILQAEPNLTGLSLQGETVRVTIDPVSTEELSRIWNLFPTRNYRTSVVYLATPVWIDPVAPPVLAPPVTHEPHQVGPIAPAFV